MTNEWKGGLFANWDWQERYRESDGKVFYTLLVGVHNLGLERKDNTAYIFTVNEGDTIRVNDQLVSLKSYADFLVKNATGDINPRGALVIRCDEVGCGEPMELTYKDGRKVNQIVVYPVGDFALDIVQKSRPKPVSLEGEMAVKFAAWRANAAATVKTVAEVQPTEEPF
jgi:hypothetical protein